jgi:protein tyrosine phosphatase (PTP) superfamily phosphohydrolase (DUF442 family)
MRVASWIVVLLLAAGGCGQGHPTQPSAAALSIRLEAAGLPKAFRLSEHLYSGANPEGDAGFAALEQLGVRTIISVDAAKPDVDAARRHGLRYVHLPVGYDGIPRERALQLARAVRDLPGPTYVHCHHGKHRGPAAAAAIMLCLEESFTTDAAEAWLKRAGTDPHYTGLIGLPRTLQRPAPGELDNASADFPEVAPVGPLAETMVQIDERWDHLKALRSAGWQTPSEDADLDAPHEALQLLEEFRELARSPELRGRPAEFRALLDEATTKAETLEKCLRQPTFDGNAVEAAFRASASMCARCHERFRDVSRSP